MKPTPAELNRIRFAVDRVRMEDLSPDPYRLVAAIFREAFSAFDSIGRTVPEQPNGAA